MRVDGEKFVESVLSIRNSTRKVPELQVVYVGPQFYISQALCCKKRYVRWAYKVQITITTIQDESELSVFLLNKEYSNPLSANCLESNQAAALEN